MFGIRNRIRPNQAGTYFLEKPNPIVGTLFRKKRFEINFFVRQNASEFAILIEKENTLSFFVFHFKQL